MDVTEILNALEKISSFNLWRLTLAIHKILKDPIRIHEIQARLCLNQQITYFDTRENREISAQIVEIHRTHVLVRHLEDGKLWRVPLYMLNLKKEVFEPKSFQKEILRSSFKEGDTVCFLGRLQKELFGTIIKLNPKTAEVILPSGEQWRVPYSALSYVVDCESVNGEEPKMISDHHAS